MANPKHMAILRQGVDAWNKWRNENGEIRPDLSHNIFGRVNLTAINLSEANLNVSTFRGAILRDAILNDAELRNVDLNGADLSGASLIRANLNEADLRDTGFIGGPNLIGADLSRASLVRANLGGADLTGTNFTGANLKGANFSMSKLHSANLSGWDLSGANLDAALLWKTVFTNVDLSAVDGLETVRHQGPSSIGIDTIYLSAGEVPNSFLRGAGVPEIFITYMAPLTGQAVEYYSCFISYSGQDEPFAERLHADLQAKGVRCWYAPHDLRIGAPYMKEIDRAIRIHDKSLLILSENSVQSGGWVEREVTLAETEEMQPNRKPDIIFPVRIDDKVLESEIDWAKRLRKTRHIGDFTKWKTDHDTYQQAFDQLLRDLTQPAEQ